MIIEHKYMAPEEYPRVSWDTRFCTTKDEIIGWRYINGRPYKLVVPIASTDGIGELFSKYERLTKIDDEMYVTLSEINKRASEAEEI